MPLFRYIAYWEQLPYFWILGTPTIRLKVSIGNTMVTIHAVRYVIDISLLCRQCSFRGEFCPSQRSALCSAALHNSTRPWQNWHSYFSHSSYSIKGNCSSILTKTLKCIWSRIASQTAITQNLYNQESSQWCDGDFAAGLQYKHCMLYKCSHTFPRFPLHVTLYTAGL